MTSSTAAEPDCQTVTRHLSRLTAAYPAFEFSRESHGRRGGRWVAERRDHAEPGLYAVITSDLMELHTTLARDRDRCRTGDATDSRSLGPHSP